MELMLQSLKQDFSGDAEMVAKTAEVLELGFRAEMAEGFPNFNDSVSTFSNKQPYKERDDIVQIIEQCKFGDGSKTTNKLVVGKTANGWKVIAVPD